MPGRKMVKIDKRFAGVGNAVDKVEKTLILWRNALLFPDFAYNTKL